MRALLVSPLFLGLLMACPTRDEGTGVEGEGEGEGEVPAGPACDIGGLDVAVDTAVAAAGPVAGGAPDVSCIGNPRVVSGSTPVILQGCVDIFGVGNAIPRGVTVSVVDAADDPSTATPLASASVFVANDAGVVEGGCGAHPDEPACLALNCSSQGYYRLTSTIPTHTQLTMKIASSNPTVVDTYLWGLVFFDEEAVAGTINYEAAIIFASTYASIPSLSGRQINGAQDLRDGEGRGVIAGELHDCSDVIIQNGIIAMDDFDQATMTLTYFDGDANDPKPAAPPRHSSASDGLYAVLNVPSDLGSNGHRIVGGFRDACTGDDCSCVSLGERTILTFPDSVSIVTLRGDFPVLQ